MSNRPQYPPHVMLCVSQRLQCGYWSQEVAEEYLWAYERTTEYAFWRMRNALLDVADAVKQTPVIAAILRAVRIKQ